MILITGAAGFVGNAVLRRYLETQPRERFLCPVISTSRRVFVHPRVDWTIFDLRRHWPFAPAEIVLNFAAEADPTSSDPTIYGSNATIAARLAEYARRTGAKAVHLSTNEVFGQRAGASHFDPVSPLSPYGVSKACQEMVLEHAPVQVVRAQSICGERQQPDKFFPTMVRALLSGQPFRLQLAFRPWLYVADLADCLMDLAGLPFLATTEHLVAGAVLPNKDLVRWAAQALAAEPNLEETRAPDRAGHETDNAMEPTVVAPSLKIETVHHLARWYHRHPEWL